VDFALTEEQEDFVDAIRRYCDHECGTPDQRERLTEGYTEHHNETIYKEMAELGWTGLTIPEEYGGSGGTMLDACIFMEETSRALAPIGGYATTLIVAGATMRFGSEEQKTEILGVEIPFVQVPITPGKNITVIAEVIALNYLVKVTGGYSPAERLNRHLLEVMKRKSAARTWVREDTE